MQPMLRVSLGDLALSIAGADTEANRVVPMDILAKSRRDMEISVSFILSLLARISFGKRIPGFSVL